MPMCSETMIKDVLPLTKKQVSAAYRRFERRVPKEDLYSEALYQLFLALQKYKVERGEWKRYAATTVRHGLARAYRRHKRYKNRPLQLCDEINTLTGARLGTHPTKEKGFHSSGHTPESLYGEKEQTCFRRNSVLNLDYTRAPQQKKIIQLIFSGYRKIEIARLLNTSRRNVDNQLTKVIAKWRKNQVTKHGNCG